MSSKVWKKDKAEGLSALVWKTWPSVTGEPIVGPAAGPGAPGRASAATHGADTERLVQAALERGRQEGQAAATRENLNQLNAAIQGFAQSAAAVSGHKAALRREAERDMVSLSLAIARKIVRRELSIDPDIVLAVVRACLEGLENAEVYRLRLHPQDVQAVAGYLQQHRRSSIELVPDPALSRGDAVLETSKGQLDARMETQFREIERGLADR